MNAKIIIFWLISWTNVNLEPWERIKKEPYGDKYPEINSGKLLEFFPACNSSYLVFGFIESLFWDQAVCRIFHAPVQFYLNEEKNLIFAFCKLLFFTQQRSALKTVPFILDQCHVVVVRVL